MSPLVIGFQAPGPTLIVGAVLAGALVLLAGRADMRRLGEWALVGGWFVFALSSPSGQFPTMLRPLGLLGAFAGAVILRFGDPLMKRVEEHLVPYTTKLLFVYLAFVFIGCLASPLGPKNIIRWVQGVMIVVAVFYAISLRYTRALLASTFLAALFNVVLTVENGSGEVLPDGAHTNRLAGYMQPNHLAFACALVIIGAVWLAHDTPKWRVPMAGCGLIAFYALMASHSRTALMALIAALGAAVVATYVGRGRRGQFVAWSLVAVLVFTPLVLPAFGTWFNRDDSESSITSLTGRTDFWPLAVDLIQERPIVGWGINVIGSPAGAAFQEVLPGVGQAHNAYLEAALMSGYPGVLAWGGSLLGVMIGAFRLRRDDPYRFLLIASSILVQIFAITESSPAWFGDMFIVYVLAAAIYGEQRVRAPDTERELAHVS